MVLTAPIFWHSGQHVQPHQLPDARSDPKGRTLLRRMRLGYAAMSDETMPDLSSDRSSERTQTPEPVVENPFDSQQYTDDPPEYDLESLGQDLPPALPGYTPLPDSAPKPIGKEDPEPRQRRRYLYVLKRRISSTKQRFNKSTAKSIDEESISSAESERGVVMYQQDNQWVNVEEANMSTPEEKPRTVKGWIRKVWRSIKEFSREHPSIFILAVFLLVIVAICLLI
ncbi:hypothetical protein J7T55_010843 [Diaporthe amygdali]|uniref:uncharacterized protein n=1 Tax=Phomopsis amygdali TaxID=1214568 RepID=UPI0022FE6B62|nr:uncharacterized protein J7T55_010843 [Diaporthe amygdali]KAJ0114453.1 hypothetical protein J7T55_010843 [Diaporthe amygdali]